LPEEDTNDNEARMTFTEHLGELRTRLIRAVLSVAVAFVFCAFFSDRILYYLAKPLIPEATQNVETTGENGAGSEGASPSGTGAPAASPRKANVSWTTLGALEGLIVRFKVAIYAAIVLAFPYILYQACAFIFPGLKPNEVILVKYLLLGCGALATLGVATAYFGVFPLVLPYLLEYTPVFAEAQLRLDENISLIIMALLGFCVAFQFPMAVLVLVYMGLLSPETLSKHRRVAIVGLAVASAFFTPPDPFSMMIMLVPLVLLYEISIILSRIMVRRRAAASTGT